VASSKARHGTTTQRGRRGASLGGRDLAGGGGGVEGGGGKANRHIPTEDATKYLFKGTRTRMRGEIQNDWEQWIGKPSTCGRK